MIAELKESISLAIAEATGTDLEITSCQTQGGGCINEAWRISGDKRNYFVKLNAANRLQMFVAESAALSEIAAADAIRVPHPVTYGSAAGQSFLVLEALTFGRAQAESWDAMGKQLARLHRCTAERFGWHRENVIGSTPQRNHWKAEWPDFFREQRLRPQFELARRNGFKYSQTEALLQQVERILADHKPEPSLLHGDLWSGNAGFLEDGTPVIYDPASYYGDRETDLAFSEFFGGFPSSFYQAYEKEWPLPPSYVQRKLLYNLYHVLNHANLFGGGYAGQAEAMMQRLLTTTSET